MSFRAVFIAVVIGSGLIVAALIVNWYRPRVVIDQRCPPTRPLRR